MVEEQTDLTRATEQSATEPPFRIVRRGFDREQVQERLSRAEDRASRSEGRAAELESRLEQALIELAEARRELAEARTEHDPPATVERDPYEGVSEHVMELVRGFDREVDRLRRRAELDASGIVAEARTEAARMRLEVQKAEERARAQVELLLGEARKEAEDVRAQLAPLRELTLSQARAIRDRMRISLLELDAILPYEPAEEPVIVLGEASDAPAPPVDLPPPSPPGKG